MLHMLSILKFHLWNCGIVEMDNFVSLFLISIFHKTLIKVKLMENEFSSRFHSCLAT